MILNKGEQKTHRLAQPQEAFDGFFQFVIQSERGYLAGNLHQNAGDDEQPDYSWRSSKDSCSLSCVFMLPRD
jgi:hypothetical protein